MKLRNQLLSLGFALSAALSAQAQVQATIREEVRSMSKGAQNSLVLDLPGTTQKNVESGWKTYLKDFKGKTDLDRKTGEFFSDDVLVKEISENTIDIYAKISPKGDSGTEVTIWFNVGLDYLSSAKYPQQYPAAEKMLAGFVRLMSLEMIEAELKDQEKKLKDLESQLKDLEKVKASKEADIAKYRATIAEMEKNIQKTEGELAQNANDQGNKQGEIATQKQVIDNVKQRLEQVKAGAK